ncbi:PH domain-containing protein [Cellulomonas composti]|uniref:YdbS-like PH domain-containing protein n=1 Tax=Cellulomonas composti TaxID=266130 RepID=A0A511JCI4_9CELL|nr:PH domain-containing protein [Cellulomonas composti]GEL95717.1 hypothetical protein CCO02nite_23750 [Cellulomonas composti]
MTEDELDAGPVPEDRWRRMHPATPALRGWKVVFAVLLIVWYQIGDNLQDAYRLIDGHAWLYMLGGLAVVALVGVGWSAIVWRVTRFAVTDDAVHVHSGLVFRQQRRARLDRLQAVDVVQPLLARLVGLAELKLEVAGGSGSAVELAYLRESDAQALRAELLALAAGLRQGSAGAASGPVAADGVPFSVEAAPGSTDPTTAPTSDPTSDPTSIPTSVPAAAGTIPAVRATRLTDRIERRFEDAPEQEVYTVPTPRLLIATLRSGAVVGLVAAAIAVVVGVILADGDIGAAFVFVPGVFALVGFVWNRVNSGAGFRAAISPDGIRLRHGLTEARTQTVPPGRVQAVRIHQGLWWRGPDWWRVEMNVAGYAQAANNARETVLHPVATRDEAATALWLVLPDLGVADPRALLDAALSGRDEDGGFLTAPRRARWLDPFGWRRRGVFVTSTALLVRSGRWGRQLDVVPHERTQSLGYVQGPWQRRLGVATIAVHSTPGPVTPRVEHLDADALARLLDEQAERARAARALAGPEQWMRGTA